MTGSLGQSSLQTAASPLRQPAGLLSVAVHPPSALPGQPPNGETPALFHLHQSLKGRGFAKDILCPQSTGLTTLWLRVWPHQDHPANDDEVSQIKLRDKSLLSVRQRVGSHHPRTHFLLFEERHLQPGTTPWLPSPWSPHSPVGRAVKTLLWREERQGDWGHLPYLRQQDQIANISVFGRAGRVGKGMRQDRISLNSLSYI